MRLRDLVPAAGIAAMALAAPAGASAAKVHGTVVHRNSHSHSFVVASAGGRLYSIHARKAPAVRRVATVRVRRLANGTYKALAIRAGGRDGRVKLRGTVSFRRGRRFVVSARGASLRVRLGRHAGTPRVGHDVTVTADVERDGDLTATRVSDDGVDRDGMEVEGVVRAIDTDAGTITISADDDGESPQSLVVHADGLDLSGFRVGEVVELHVSRASDGSLHLLGLACDDDAARADDRGRQQGQQEDDDDAGEHHHRGGDDAAGDDHGGRPGSDDHGDRSGRGGGDDDGSGSSGSDDY